MAPTFISTGPNPLMSAVMLDITIVCLHSIAYRFEAGPSFALKPGAFAPSPSQL